jgi:hypothetical protein
MQRSKLVVTDLIKVNNNIVWHCHVDLPSSLLLSSPHIDDLGLFDLVLLNEPYQLLFLTLHSNHIIDFLDKQLSGLFIIYLWLFLHDLPSKGRQRRIGDIDGLLIGLLNHRVGTIWL